jgi:hypothetical protein
MQGKRQVILAGLQPLTLAFALKRSANVNLHQSANQATEVVLALLLDEMKIVVTPSLQEEDIATRWLLEPGIPLVWADRSGLMNVVRLANRAAQNSW